LFCEFEELQVGDVCTVRPAAFDIIDSSTNENFSQFELLGRGKVDSC
jgi:hypothetical protein